MWVGSKVNILFFIFFWETTICVPANEFSDREFGHVDFQKPIVPSGFSPPKTYNDQNHILPLFQNIDKAYHHKLKLLNQLLEKGHANNAFTFNIYDDNMREAAVTLINLLEDIQDKEQLKSIITWMTPLINNDIFEYVYRVLWLFTNKIDSGDLPLRAVNKPNYFINAETIIKTYKLRKIDVRYKNYDEEARLNGITTTSDGYVINTNYSGWNLWENGCEEELNYFREDVGLNSYYYGLSVKHPFWMSNDELDKVYPKHAEHYYFAHQQLMARYLLEKEHLKQRNLLKEGKCKSGYNPYLIYSNGLSIPVRQPPKEEWSEERAKLKSIDIAIKECISRGIIVMDNGNIINMTEENHTELLAKLIRANLDNIKTGKMIRSLYGYGGNQPDDQYNPAPSVLHNAETCLRDPLFWKMIGKILNYFTEYKNNLEPNDLSQYLTDDLNIIDNNFSKITTHFEYYNLKLQRLFDYEMNFSVSARQSRLTHLPFTLNFTVESKVTKDVRVRLFLGPQCNNDNVCWQQFSSFYQLDNYRFYVTEGKNILSWSPKKNIYHLNECCNLEKNPTNKKEGNSYIFPENLIIPRGLEEGLNLTLFFMITPIEDNRKMDHLLSKMSQCKLNIYDVEYPLGAPFHRQTVINDNSFNNYKFYNISVYHKRTSVDGSDYFSPHLY